MADTDDNHDRRRAELFKRSDRLLQLSEDLHRQAVKAFPGVASSDFTNWASMSREERLRTGAACAVELVQMAFRINPETTMDLMEQSLANDARSRRAMVLVLARCKANSR